jgi:hypothetical protein
MTQEDAGPAPMRGSVAVTWAVMYPNGKGVDAVYEHEADAREAACGDQEVVPLYRSPKLTECERVAMRFFVEKHRKIQREGENYCCLEASPHADAIQGLLERLA